MRFTALHVFHIAEMGLLRHMNSATTRIIKTWTDAMTSAHFSKTSIARKFKIPTIRPTIHPDATMLMKYSYLKNTWKRSRTRTKFRLGSISSRTFPYFHLKSLSKEFQGLSQFYGTDINQGVFNFPQCRMVCKKTVFLTSVFLI